jgi:hypothetical protein
VVGAGDGLNEVVRAQLVGGTLDSLTSFAIK